LKVTAIKIDPYMNIDAGTMRPTEHGAYCCSLFFFRGRPLIMSLQARSTS
jgi:hypothetical protein